MKVAGLPAVAALFAKAPERVERLFFTTETKQAAGAFCTEMAKARKPYRLVTPEELTKVAGTPMHGNIVAVAKPREVLPFEPAQAKEWAKDGKPLLILDGISNPHNLGAIARTAAFFGIPRMVLSDHPAQAGVSDASYRVAEGGLDCIDLYKAKNFTAALKKLREFYHVIAAAPGDHVQLTKLKPAAKPFALVLGNEEHGMPEVNMKACDRIVAIPGEGQIQSLNVSASAAILIYAITQKG